MTVTDTGEIRHWIGSSFSFHHFNIHFTITELIRMFQSLASRVRNCHVRLLSTSGNQLKSAYEFVIAEKRGAVGLITLNRPKALNALCNGLSEDLVHAARAFDDMDDIGAIVVTGSEKAFAAGADIKEMASKTYVEVYTKNMFKSWTNITKITKPVS